ncbi:TfoX/Sxy family protein [Burkholderia multivorans]|uniref:TfoX/Sxy family protein n=1 Tax=Burkholderia multivorans TaxID=87883 RepID=UPI001C21F54C|nr:TfoX/Sxy family protein [Burkholderia multivorans]MBU9556631.1 TfoX/Sxy family protein [Burkholderia multivorans]
MSWQAEKARGDEIAYQLSGLGAVTVTRLFGGAALRLDGYYETPADVLEDAGALFDWCRSAYRAALLAGPPKGRTRAAPKAKRVTARKRA